MVDDTSRTVVWKAVQNTLDRTVIIRILKPDASSNPSEVDHFLSIARLFARIKSESIAAVFDIVSEGDLHYVVMEHVEGPTLEELVTSHGPLSLDKILRIATALINSLEQMWQTAHIVHRNLKSSTIRLDPRGVAKITDFSLAITAGIGVDATSLDGGHIVGTPCYLSPEQAQGSHMLNNQSDMYALGVVLYHLATGKVPFEDLPVVSILAGHIKQQIPPPHVLNRHLPASFSWLLHRLMMKNPSNRFVDWDHVIRDIRRISDGSAPSCVRPDDEYLSTIDMAHPVGAPSDDAATGGQDGPKVRLKRRGSTSEIAAFQGDHLFKGHASDIRRDDLTRGIVCWSLLAGWLMLVFWFRAVYQCEPPNAPSAQAQPADEPAAPSPAPAVSEQAPPAQPVAAATPEKTDAPAQPPSPAAAVPPPPAKAAAPAQAPSALPAGIPPALVSSLAQALANNDLTAARVVVKNAVENFQEKEALLSLLSQAVEPDQAVAEYLKAQIGKPLLFEHKGKQRTVIPRSIDNGVIQLEANGRGAEFPIDKLSADEKMHWMDIPQDAASCLTYCLVLLHSSHRDELRSRVSGCPLLVEAFTQALSLVPEVTPPAE